MIRSVGKAYKLEINPLVCFNVLGKMV